MGERIEDGYRDRFRGLLALVRPKRLEFGADLLLRRARARSEREGIPLVRALADLYEFTRVRVARRLEVTGACAVVQPPWRLFGGQASPRFFCDASLGGLARWLRAAGYPARWRPRCRGLELLPEARQTSDVLLTSDSRLMRQRPIVEGAVAALWVPSGLTRLDQLRLVLGDLGLDLRKPLCMACGGELRPVAKDDVRERIPPRTARWKDEYFVCAGCGRLFWKGTHWERIAARLEGATALAS